jgi:hypothetical protein
MNGRAAAWAGGAAGALAACLLARLARPLWPVPDGGVGFVTVHSIPKGIDTLRYLLLLVLIPAGALVSGRVAAAEPAGNRRREEEEESGRTVLATAVILAAALAVLRVLASDGIHGPIDLFHAGHYLSPASDALAGKAFFRDVFPFHGLAADGGLDAAAFRIAGETLATARGLRVVLDVLFFSGAAAIFAGALRRPARIAAGVAILLLASGALRLPGSFPFFRTMPLLICAAAAAWHARTGRLPGLVVSGAAAAIGLFWSLETGLFACAGVVVACVAEPWYRREPGRIGASIMAGVGGIALVLLPASALLAAHGALAAFARDSATILSSTGAIWDLPAPVPRDVARAALHGPVALLRSEATRFYVPQLFFGGLAAALLLRRRDRGAGAREAGLAILLIFAAIGFRTALGRTSYSHTRFSMIVPALLLAACLPEKLFRPRRPRAAGVAWGAAAAVAFALYAELPESVRDTAEKIRSLASRREGAGMEVLGLPRGGGVRVPAGQAASLSAMALFAGNMLGPGETFYDFADAGALYFLLGRSNPTRFYEASILSADAWQARTIAELERGHPRFVVVSAGQGGEAFDGVPIAVRCPVLAAWIDARYPEVSAVGDFVVRTQAVKTPSR